MNIAEFIIKNNLPHEIVDGKVVQNGSLYLSSIQITSLDGFVQNGTLYLHNNKITSLEGFVQNGTLHLSDNPIPNSKNVFKNPRTGRFILYDEDLNTYSCGCFYKKTPDEFKEKCIEEGFTEIIEYFNL